MEIHSMPKGERPHVLGYYSRPLSHSMKKNGACMLCNGPDEFLGNAVLPVSSDSTKYQFLLNSNYEATSSDAALEE